MPGDSNAPRLPTHASVVVIGGGVMGCSTLYHLARHGIGDCILIERNALTSGTTWHSAAQVRALRSTRNMTRLIRYSIELYSRLEEETGQATGWINKGSLSIATTPDRFTHIRRQERLAHLYGVPAKTVSPEAAREFWPLMNTSDVIGAVWSPDDGRVSPSDLCAALVRGAKSSGARVFEDTAVSGIVTDAGRVRALETSAGAVSCDAVAICAGLWSREMAALAGAEVPVWPCEHFYLLTRPVDGIAGNLPTLSDHDGHLYIRDDSGGLLVGCFEPRGKAIAPGTLGGDFAFQLLPEDWDHFEPMMVNALHRLPALETAEVRMLLNGPESFTPDGAFMLGESAETSGLFLGCGMNSVGVATGGGAGMALAHCIAHGSMPMDLHEVDPKRFPACFNDVRALSERVPEVLGKHYEITYPHRQWKSARMLRLTPLHERWVGHGACFGQVYGWERPLFFGSRRDPRPTFGRPDWFANVGREVAAAHTRAAIFDQSTFGKIDVRGRDACSFLQRVCANDMDRAPGRAVYTAMLNAHGGIESDLTALRLSDDHYRLFVSTAAVRHDLCWLRRRLEDEDVALCDVTDQFAVLGLMGPEAMAIVARSGAPQLSRMTYFSFARAQLAGIDVIATRLSYVGESGLELTCASEHAPALFDALSGLGAVPAGLLAQTSMRIEKRFLAYGHDMDTDVSPIHAGLDFAVDWNKPFIGRDALRRQRDAGGGCRLVSLLFDDAAANPAGHEPVMVNGKIVGQTTSAAFGYRVNAPVAIADVHDAAGRKAGGQVDVDIAGDTFAATVLAGCAYDPQGSRMRAR